MAWIWGPRRFGRLFCAKETETSQSCFKSAKDLPRDTSDGQMEQPKTSHFLFQLSWNTCCPWFFSLKWKIGWKGKNWKGFLCLFSVLWENRSPCFLLYTEVFAFCCTSDLLMHNACRDKLQSDTLVSPHQVRPKELGCNPILYTLLARTDLQL